MFYIHGKFSRNRMKIKEVEALTGVLQPSFYVRIPCGAPPCDSASNRQNTWLQCRQVVIHLQFCSLTLFDSVCIMYIYIKTRK